MVMRGKVFMFTHNYLQYILGKVMTCVINKIFLQKMVIYSTLFFNFQP